MTAGETILKFTDYPFAYSFIGIILIGLGFEFSQNHILFLGIAGTIGTLLTLSDPIGRLVRNRAEKRIDEKFSNNKEKTEPTTIDFMKSSIKSRSIAIEIDKMVGLWYFVITTIVFAIVITSSTTFATKLIENLPSTITCNVLCVKVSSMLGVSIIFLILGYLAVIFWKELDNKIEIAGYHQQAISNEFVTENSVENMSRSVESGDWETAKLWWKKIQEEIKYKKGKRELIIKSADLLFSPLHREATMSANNIKGMIYSRNHPSFDIGEWSKIKQNSYQSIIEDVELRKRIDSFYNRAQEYNDKIGLISRLTNDIIFERAFEIYGHRVNGISYDINSDQGNGRVDLANCALQNIHPLDYYRIRGTLQQIEIRFLASEGRTTEQYSDNVLFDKMWKIVVTDVQQNNEIQNFLREFNELKIENSKLMKIYSEKIEMQWKV